MSTLFVRKYIDNYSFRGNSGLYLVLKNVSFIVTVIEDGLNRLDISFERGVTLEDARKTACHP